MATDSSVLIDISDGDDPASEANDDPSVDTLQTYEKELNSLIETINKSISLTTPQQNLDIPTAQNKLSEANDVLDAMDLEASSTPIPSPLIEKIENYKSLLEKAQRNLTSAQRRRLLHHPSSNPSSSSIAQSDQQRVTDNTQRLEESSNRLLESRKKLAETENVGTNILQDLQNQRETLLKSRANLGNVDQGLNESRRILRGIGERAVVNRVGVYVLVAGILLMAVLLVYWRVFRQWGGGFWSDVLGMLQSNQGMFDCVSTRGLRYKWKLNLSEQAYLQEKEAFLYSAFTITQVARTTP